MKSIKWFRYRNTYNFENLLSAYGYILDDVKGFKFVEKKQYHGNVLKLYFICLKDGEEICFTAVYFTDFNECRQSRLGFNGDKLLGWYRDAGIREYKVKDIWGVKDYSVIEN